MVSTKMGWLLKGNGAHKRAVFPYVDFCPVPFICVNNLFPSAFIV